MDGRFWEMRAWLFIYSRYSRYSRYMPNLGTVDVLYETLLTPLAKLYLKIIKNESNLQS